MPLPAFSSPPFFIYFRHAIAYFGFIYAYWYFIIYLACFSRLRWCHFRALRHITLIFAIAFAGFIRLPFSLMPLSFLSPLLLFSYWCDYDYWYATFRLRCHLSFLLMPTFIAAADIFIRWCFHFLSIICYPITLRYFRHASITMRWFSPLLLLMLLRLLHIAPLLWATLLLRHWLAPPLSAACRHCLMPPLPLMSWYSSLIFSFTPFTLPLSLYYAAITPRRHYDGHWYDFTPYMPMPEPLLLPPLIFYCHLRCWYYLLMPTLHDFRPHAAYFHSLTHDADADDAAIIIDIDIFRLLSHYTYYAFIMLIFDDAPYADAIISPLTLLMLIFISLFIRLRRITADIIYDAIDAFLFYADILLRRCFRRLLLMLLHITLCHYAFFLIRFLYLLPLYLFSRRHYGRDTLIRCRHYYAIDAMPLIISFIEIIDASSFDFFMLTPFRSFLFAITLSLPLIFAIYATLCRLMALCCHYFFHAYFAADYAIELPFAAASFLPHCCRAAADDYADSWFIYYAYAFVLPIDWYSRHWYCISSPRRIALLMPLRHYFAGYADIFARCLRWYAAADIACRLFSPPLFRWYWLRCYAIWYFPLPPPISPLRLRFYYAELAPLPPLRLSTAARHLLSP